MMTISAIEDFSRGKGRVRIDVDGEFSFVLYKGELSEYGLKEGMVLDEDLYEDILVKTLIPRAKKRGMNLLMKNDRTEADIRLKLSQSGYPDRAIDEAVDYLKSFHYVDDVRFAEEFIRFKKAAKSRRQIESELIGKGIDRNIVENALEEAFSEDEGGEEELIERLIRKKCKTAPSNLEDTDKRKLYAYLYGKGFLMSDIDKVFRHLT